MVCKVLYENVGLFNGSVCSAVVIEYGVGYGLGQGLKL